MSAADQLARTAPPDTRWRLRVLALAVIWVMWLLPTAGLGSALVGDAEDYVGVACEIPGADSDYGSATWSWWPPGETCRDHEGRVFRAPAAARSVLLVVAGAGVVVLPLLTLALFRSRPRRRRAMTPER